jgi:hypothetical protein
MALAFGVLLLATYVRGAHQVYNYIGYTEVELAK